MLTLTYLIILNAQSRKISNLSVQQIYKCIWESIHYVHRITILHLTITFFNLLLFSASAALIYVVIIV